MRNFLITLFAVLGCLAFGAMISIIIIVVAGRIAFAEARIDQMMELWFRYRSFSGDFPEEQWQNNPLLARRVILETTTINPVSAKRIISELLYLDAREPGKPIDFYLRTNGGIFDDGFSVYNIIQSLHSKVNVHAMGACAGPGVVILAGASGVRSIASDGLVSFNGEKKFKDNQDEFNPEKLQQQRLFKFIQHKTKLPVDWLYAQREYSLTAQDALRYGVVDAVEKTSTLPNENK